MNISRGETGPIHILAEFVCPAIPNEQFGDVAVQTEPKHSKKGRKAAGANGRTKSRGINATKARARKKKA